MVIHVLIFHVGILLNIFSLPVPEVVAGREPLTKRRGCECSTTWLTMEQSRLDTNAEKQFFKLPDV
jgi:hypothetical protein